MEGRDTRIKCVWVRALRGRGADDAGLLARPDSPRRCTLPITAFRVMPPSSAAIWLADRPSPHSFFRLSTRSSVQVMRLPPGEAANWSRQNPSPAPVSPRPTRRLLPLLMNSETCPPHEMSYLTGGKLQYGGSPAQESVRLSPHLLIRNVPTSTPICANVEGIAAPGIFTWAAEARLTGRR